MTEADPLLGCERCRTLSTQLAHALAARESMYAELVAERRKVATARLALDSCETHPLAAHPELARAA